MIAYRRWEATLCGVCRQSRRDWLDDDGVPFDPPRYEPVAERCPSCAESDRLRSHLADAKADMAGVHVVVAPFDPDRSPLEPGAD